MMALAGALFCYACLLGEVITGGPWAAIAVCAVASGVCLLGVFA